MSTAIRNTKIRKNMMEAHRWLRDQGYDCIRGCWMKDRSFARGKCCRQAESVSVRG